MKVGADTNVLLRAFLGDHPEQSPRAQRLLNDAELVAVSLPTICELTWVLHRGHRRTRPEILDFILEILATANVALDRLAVEAGVALAEEGGDFADGVIAFETRRLGGEIFATFDKAAASKLRRQGVRVTVPD